MGPRTSRLNGLGALPSVACLRLGGREGWTGGRRGGGMRAAIIDAPGAEPRLGDFPAHSGNKDVVIFQGALAGIYSVDFP